MIKIRFSLLLILWFIGCVCMAQQVEKVINMGIYKSYYSFSIKNPLYVTYKLYKGGGECDRQEEGFNFRLCDEKNTARNSDYTHSGYERGHLANAEDFASDCTLEEKTFCYFNCVPQTWELNHGEWLDYERKIREMSQTRRLFIVAGSIFKKKPIKPGSKVMVPEACYKIVIEEETGKQLLCMIFPNDKSKNGWEISLSKLKSMLSYPLVPEEDLGL